MRSRHRARLATLALAFSCAVGGIALAPAPASATNPVSAVCGVAGLFSGLAGKACKVAQGGGKLLGIGKRAVGGGSTVARAAGIAAVGAWVLLGARLALRETAVVLDRTTRPQLQSTWFSSTYWRMVSLAAVLTLPFLFAAALQALIRSDLALLMRAALVYLPMAILAVSIAAPVTMLLLAATDEMSALVASGAAHAGTRFLARAGTLIGGLAVVAGAPFLVVVVGLFTVAGAVVLWLELLMREAAVYVVVLMLPLAFAAFVWPARRTWAIRAVELLAALILSKFAIVAVLALGGAALGQSHFSGVSGMMAGTVLVTMGAFAPWALLRLLPLAELASGAAGALRGDARVIREHLNLAAERAGGFVGDGTVDGEFDGDGEGGSGRAARAETERLAGLPEPPAGLPEPPAPARALPIGSGDDDEPPARSGESGPPGRPGPPDPPDPPGPPEPPEPPEPPGPPGPPEPPEPLEAPDPPGSSGRPERSPGLGPIFQRDDYDWEPFTLGEWPPATPEAPSDGDAWPRPVEDGPQ
jgi:hypothetical protein